MLERPSQRLSVILERRAIESRWQSHEWALGGVLPDAGGDARVVEDTPALLRRLHPGLEVTLYRDEAEGYFLNASSEEPSAFVSIRTPEEGGDPYPFQVTLSYNEAARWMDSNERVERTPIWPALASWLSDYVAANYKPEPKKRRKPRSFAGKEGVLRAEGDQ